MWLLTADLWLTDTFARAGVVQVKSAPPLGAFQVAFSGKELTRRIISFIVCPTHLQGNNQ